MILQRGIFLHITCFFNLNAAQFITGDEGQSPFLGPPSHDPTQNRGLALVPSSQAASVRDLALLLIKAIERRTAAQPFSHMDSGPFWHIFWDLITT